MEEALLDTSKSREYSPVLIRPNTPALSLRKDRDRTVSDEDLFSSIKTVLSINRDLLLNSVWDLERLRVNFELARLPLLGFDICEIPVGYLYENVPSDGDESAYDALEKAYNASFLTTSATKFIRNDQVGCLGSSFSSDAIGDQAICTRAVVDELKNIHVEFCAGQENVLSPFVSKSMSFDVENEKNIQSTESLRKIQALRQSRLFKLSTSKQKHNSIRAKSDFIWQQQIIRTKDSQAQSVLSKSTFFHVQRAKKLELLRRISKKCEKQLSIGNNRSDLHDSTRVSSSFPLQYDIEGVDADTRLSNVTRISEYVRRVPEENTSLNAFLLKELHLLANLMLGQEDANHVDFDEDGDEEMTMVALVSSRGLLREHLSGLREFDADSKRLRPKGERAANGDSSRRGRVIKNPFKFDDSTSHRWHELLQSRSIYPKSKAYPSMNYVGELNQTCKLVRFFQKGVNALFVDHEMGCFKYNKICQFYTSMAGIVEGLNLLACLPEEIMQWHNNLTINASSVRVYPYYGNKIDRDAVISFFFKTPAKISSIDVLLVPFDVFLEDMEVLYSIPFQTCVVDDSRNTCKNDQTLWSRLLSIRCRMRLLLVSYVKASLADARVFLQFILPNLFTSRLKIMAWSCAGFKLEEVKRLCNVVRLFTVGSGSDVLEQFVHEIESQLKIYSSNERSTLSMLDTQVVVTHVSSPRRIIMNSRSTQDVNAGKFHKQYVFQEHIESQHAPLSSWCYRKCEAIEGLSDHEALHDSQAGDFPQPAESRNFKPLKHLHVAMASILYDTPDHKKSDKDLLLSRSKSSLSRSKKRISRCGQCAGCMSDDCMTCGHCQDMKKYGGPGLRKQSCKNRKCLNPRATLLLRDNTMKEKVENNESERGYSSDELKPEANELSDVSISDSDDDFSRKNSADMFLDLDEGEKTDRLFLKSGRTRVMRCGKCIGCRAPDCLKCRHCLDMKKYGGPGLRKQSCKSRKCNSPKIVMLNQPKDDDVYDEKADAIKEIPGEDHPETIREENYNGKSISQMNSRLGLLCINQEQQAFVDAVLQKYCSICHGKFPTEKYLVFHNQLEHPIQEVPCGVYNQRDSIWLRDVFRFMLNPVVQTAIMVAHNLKPTLGREPPGFAKLQGPGIKFYIQSSRVVLGRLSTKWCDLYKSLGITDIRGLPGEGVDCHLGLDKMISRRHAMIYWKASMKSFFIECLSTVAPITVNGQEVSFSSAPVILRSRNIVQVGGTYFYFLLPNTSSRCHRRASLHPSAEVKGWLRSKVERRAAEVAYHDSLAAEVRPMYLKKRKLNYVSF